MHGMDAVVAIGLIRMAAADRVLAPWQRPSDERLVQLGLDALLADVEAPSLALLAGLGRNEYHEAPELFERVLEELGLLPLMPEDLAEARWIVALWWARRILERDLDPLCGAKLIRLEVAAELDYPDILQPIVDLAMMIEPLDDQAQNQGNVRGDVIAAAQAFLNAETHRRDSA
ncbi:hypothetical protein [Embleya sp. NPDC005575]|uniref:hypothetical protein n=1 Tax=Embleya sp. NPDC005575 TaxID=3156892 RepID=UPI0033A708FC